MNNLLMNNLNQQDQLGCINMFWVEATVFLKSISGPIRCEVWGSVLVSKIRGLLDIWKTRLVLIRGQYWSPSEGIVSPSKCSVWSHHLVSHNDYNVTTHVTCEAQKDVGNTCMLLFIYKTYNFHMYFLKTSNTAYETNVLRATRRLFQLGGMLVCTWRCMAPVDAVDIGGIAKRRGYAWVACCWGCGISSRELKSPKRDQVALFFSNKKSVE